MASKATVRSAVDDQHTRGKISVSHQQLSDGWYVRVGFVLDGTMLAKEISEIHVSSPSTNFRTEAAPDDE